MLLRPLAAATAALLLTGLATACDGEPLPEPGYRLFRSGTYFVHLPTDWYDAQGDPDIEWTAPPGGGPDTGIITSPDGTVIVHTLWDGAEPGESAQRWMERSEAALEREAESYEQLSLDMSEDDGLFGDGGTTAVLEFDAVLRGGESQWADVEYDDPHRRATQKVIVGPEADTVFAIRASVPAAEAAEHEDTVEDIVDSFRPRPLDMSRDV
ncbi:hypothetical protein DFP74_2940 [Nocardiopsis sp. Huas11]|uniref:hypothetical protein n=1 Tax=Nocardiopsis sp. Huas11 TaxID=2183912 RepID=UPI000EB56CE6|nr:hypothetical protein [Nocardiopsis sp. Huas11]RKS07276.1 hypothetical protein DFP74_2940 [Nocardiopsis sp. Huas11]